MITLKAPVARKQQGFYTFSADAVLILYFCSSFVTQVARLNTRLFSDYSMRRSLTDSILSRSGKLYLKIRLQNEEKIARELSVKYEGQYRNAGLTLLFDVFMALAIVVVVGLVALLLYLTTV